MLFVVSDCAAPQYTLGVCILQFEHNNNNKLTISKSKYKIPFGFTY